MNTTPTAALPAHAQAYIHAVETHLLGNSARTAVRAELAELLADAHEAGELEATLARLGAPTTAAATFSRDRDRAPATVADRLVAAAIDNLPLIAVAIGLFVQGFAQGSATLAFPPFVYLQIGGGCVALLPFCNIYNGGLLYAVGMPLALAWSIAGLGLLESRTGRTPGKRLLGLRVVTEHGLRIAPHAGVMRRLSFLLGPLAWLDWIPALWGDRQRVLDKVSATKVVTSAAASKRAAEERSHAPDQ